MIIFDYNIIMTTIYSWNVNGIRAAQRKGLLSWLHQVSPDILCLQEIKAHPDQLDPELNAPSNYHVYWAPAERKGYSGVALYTRLKPHSVQNGLGNEEFDREGRTIIADYGDFVLINAYFPNGSRDHSRVPFKLAYCEEFLKYCGRLREAGKSIIFCGDLNTAHQEIDLARPRQNAGSTGFLPIERAWIDKVIEEGYIDAFRSLHPDQRDAYSWWAYWGKAREHNVGWRIDYFFMSPDLRDKIVAAKIHPDVFGSDHCPISLNIE